MNMQWAIFFEELGWKWEYRKLKAKKWTPDFKLRFKNHDVLIDIIEMNSCQNLSRDQIEILKSKRDSFKLNKSKSEYLMVFGSEPEFDHEAGIITLGLKLSKTDEKFYSVQVTYKPELEKAWINSFNQSSTRQAIQKRVWVRGQPLPPMVR